jgi:exosortase/archaeosortase family protein
MSRMRINGVGLYGLLIAQLLALWPVWRWYYLRLLDGSDEPWGVIALFVAVFFALLRGVRSEIDRRGLLLAILFLIAYALLSTSASPLPLAILGVVSLAFSVSAVRFGTTMNLALFALLLLSLPILASLQFYGGFPIRLVTASCAAVLLSAVGYPVEAQGSMLLYAGELVSVDAPCAGIKMLWSGLFLHFTVAAFSGLSWKWTWVGYVFTSLCIFIANIFRAAILFFFESKIVLTPSWAHQGVGIIIFALLALGIVSIDLKLLQAGKVGQVKRKRVESVPSSLVVAFYLVACAVAIAPFFRAPIAGAETTTTLASIDWPKEFKGRPLYRLPLSDKEKKFLQAFPGEVARFSDGYREILIRYVTQPTRQLHPAGDCLRGVGFRIMPLPLAQDESSQPWGCVHATRPGESLRVCERIISRGGESYSDVSSWFWGASLGRSSGPWFAYTVAEREAS